MHLNISRNTGYMAKKKAVVAIEGDYLEQYNKLDDFCREVMRANPGSTVFVKSNIKENGDEQFQRLYMCLDACVKGFINCCRPLIGLNGCFLKDHTKGSYYVQPG